MKTIHYLLILLAVALAGCSTDDDIFDIEEDTANNIKKEEPDTDNRLHVLAIGNSFSEDAVENNLYDLAHAEGKEIVIGNARIGGCDLQTHLDNINSDADAYEFVKIENGKTRTAHSAKLSQILANEDWDYICLQQVSDKSGLYDSYEPLGEILDYVTEAVPGAKIIWHSTWAYRNGETPSEYPAYKGEQLIMYEAIQDATRRLLNDYPQIAFSIPSGTAIQNMRSVLGDVLNRDVRHLETTYGRYTAACTWFEALYGIDVTGNSYAPASVDTATALLARAAAHAAILNPYSITPTL